MNHHLSWTWQFSTDGEPNVVGAKLRDHGMGILHKTHDGVTWMSEYDKSPYAVSGPRQVEVLTKYFENAGVPFHAWCVVHGTNPVKEAQMAAAVALSGPRSLYLDIEPHAGFWRGTKADALRFGEEVRRLAPHAKIVLSIDPRPWAVKDTPMREFASFSNAIAPQNYWHLFDTPGNHRRYSEEGYPLPKDGMTPEFLLEMSDALFARYGLPVIEVGGGDAPGQEWRRYLNGAFSRGSDYVTVWRYGVTTASAFDVLKDMPAKQPPVAPALASYVVQSGDTLGEIAETFGTSVDALVAQNGLSDPNHLYAGQELSIPGSGVVRTATASAQAVSTSAGGGVTHVVQSGDTLYGIAGRYNSSIDIIASANSLSDPDYIYVGQQLTIPA